MKFAFALIAAVAAESPDCSAHPNCESTQVFSYNERVPVAAGFVQLSACNQASAQGVTCVPNEELFATGMNGDEDLGETIKMKGDTFKYNQFATGMNGDEDLGETIKMKGDTFKYVEEPQDSQYFATGMNGDEDLGQTIKMKGDTFKYNQFATGMNGDEDLGETIKMKGDTFKYNQEEWAGIGIISLNTDMLMSQKWHNTIKFTLIWFFLLKPTR